jgi:hypothetical protein
MSRERERDSGREREWKKRKIFFWWHCNIQAVGICCHSLRILLKCKCCGDHTVWGWSFMLQTILDGQIIIAGKREAMHSEQPQACLIEAFVLCMCPVWKREKTYYRNKRRFTYILAHQRIRRQHFIPITPDLRSSGIWNIKSNAVMQVTRVHVTSSLVHCILSYWIRKGR